MRVASDFMESRCLYTVYRSDIRIINTLKAHMKNWLAPEQPRYVVLLTTVPPGEGQAHSLTDVLSRLTSTLTKQYLIPAPSPTTAVLRAIQWYSENETHPLPVWNFDVRLESCAGEPGVSIAYAANRRAVEEYLRILGIAGSCWLRTYTVFLAFPQTSFEQIFWMTVQTSSATEAVWTLHQSVRAFGVRSTSLRTFSVYEGQHDSLFFAGKVSGFRMPSVLREKADEAAKPRHAADYDEDNDDFNLEETTVALLPENFDPGYEEWGAPGGEDVPLLRFLGEHEDLSREVGLELLKHLETPHWSSEYGM